MSKFSQVENTNVAAVKDSAENMAKEGLGNAQADSSLTSKENQQAYKAMEQQKCGPIAQMPDLEITGLPKKFSVEDGIVTTPKDKIIKDGGPKDGGPKDGGAADGGLIEGNGKKQNLDGGPKDFSVKDAEIKHSLGEDKGGKSKFDLQKPGKEELLDAKPESK
ncbi:MAG: hypothetical protein JSS86_18620 [Cyanobacteria bacterium SZAS LIN-2]|nr:hypothetical protein [Cyanobacteria bacterium SZAS LIN-2]